jgi:hypothetical protein
MKDKRLTKEQQIYLVSELKDVVDNYEAFELESVEDYGEILTLLTRMFNEDWRTDISEEVVDDCLATYFKQELSA